MKQNKRTPESIAISLLLCSFIIAMFIFALCRACNIGIFAKGYISIETPKIVYYTISILMHIYEGFLILKILTNMRALPCLILAIAYTGLVNIVNNRTVIFLLDILYAFSIPFIFNKDKESSIKHSTYYFIGVCIYQIIMSFGRYDLTTLGKYDLGYAALSFIDYKLFLSTILLYKLRRIKDHG